MNRSLGRLARRAFFLLDPETAHGLTLKALRAGLVPGAASQPDPRLEVRAAGLVFPNPLGIAAGFDKNAQAPDALLKLGFGFAEVGTVTPLPQPGNPRPRLFRLEGERAAINRLGFNNEGHDACARRLRERRGQGHGKCGIVGVNIGANKDSADRPGDYAAGVARFAPLASYLTVNVSSPNTPGLRDLQGRESLRELLARVLAARAALPAEAGGGVPVFLKIAPDLDEAGLRDVAREVARAGIEGVIVSNTTLARPLAAGIPHAGEAGGLSGRPLFERSTAVLARTRRLLGPDIVLVGAGGVENGRTALEKIRAGADLVQIYTGFVYGGPTLPARILRAMGEALAGGGRASLREMRDTRIGFWASKPL